jgi:hypothetical protein
MIIKLELILIRSLKMGRGDPKDPSWTQNLKMELDITPW